MGWSSWATTGDIDRTHSPFLPGNMSPWPHVSSGRSMSQKTLPSWATQMAGHSKHTNPSRSFQTP